MMDSRLYHCRWCPSGTFPFIVDTMPPSHNWGSGSSVPGHALLPRRPQAATPARLQNVSKTGDDSWGLVRTPGHSPAPQNERDSTR